MHEYGSERIYLQEIRIADIDDRVAAWFDDEGLMKYYSSSKNKITRESLVESINQGKLAGNVFTYGIYVKKSDLLIGTVKIGPINFVHKTADLVTIIGDREYLSKGLAIESIGIGNKLAFEKYDLRKLISGMYELNIASVTAYRRAGWLVEGRLRGHYLVDGKPQDRILVGCFNPRYFSESEILAVKENENRYV